MRTDDTSTYHDDRGEQLSGASDEFERYVSYADGDGTIICDRRNPSAWLRSTAVRPCRR
ncbi:DUF7331 family protein [Natrinema salifodinae]|uniref:Uncharacterized protein n=1 Tax=Natrinema salifodinae TaxID=1202768 RepID=A0A1I0Q501_9EURY|nr:hypothetical protein [Natrinema salifodinae]SEW21846.1 hypothetical protein SAMN05216285_3067 [Natrinema salifodinae]